MPTWTNSQPIPRLLLWPVSILGDAVAYPIETAQFFDIDVDHLAGVIALIAAHRLRRLQVAPAVEAVAGQDPSDGRP